MVVLQQNHVEETDAVVAAAANLHGLLLQHTHTWRRLAGVKHTGTSALQPFDIPVGHRGDTAHTLHDIQHQALRLQQRTHTSRHNHSDVAFLHAATVAHQYLDLHLRVEAVEHLLGNLDTC